MVKSYDVTIDTADEATVICPKCTRAVSCAIDDWWNEQRHTECECGLTWRLELAAIGEKKWDT